LILVDAGPLVALVDSDDQHHEECVGALRKVREPLATVWPPLMEALYLLNDHPIMQNAVWEMVSRGIVGLLRLDRTDIPRMRELMQKYADLPMDVADASLICVAERETIRTIFTVDRRDFSVYRLNGRARPSLLP
jgi:uncharacterized protein